MLRLYQRSRRRVVRVGAYARLIARFASIAHEHSPAKSTAIDMLKHKF